jgi:hypothetical protein
MHFKMLSFSFIYSLGSVFLLPFWELPESYDIPRLYDVDLHIKFNHISYLCLHVLYEAMYLISWLLGM